ncbi:Sulfurtransferase [Balamuthia mandrillaris]
MQAYLRRAALSSAPAPCSSAWRGASFGEAGRRWLATKNPSEPFSRVSAEEALNCLQQYVVVDVREPDEVQAGTIPGAKHVSLGRVVRDASTEELQGLKNKKLLLYCRSGVRSAMACQVLGAKGFGEVNNLEGGWNAWKALTASKDQQ